MGKLLLIAEKPDMGRKIAESLGAKTKRNGYMEGNGLYVTWAIGHVYGLAEPQKYDSKYEKWVMEDLPIIPEKMKLVVAKGKASQVKVIKELLQKSDISGAVNCCDSGREGELIYRYITQALKVKKIPQYRLWISSLTPEAIKRGFQNLKPLSEYDNLGESARLRSEADWLVGMNGSRAFSIKFGGKGTGALSVGRVQTPTLAIIYDRQKAIENFTSTTYYEVYGYFNQEGHTYRGKWQGERIEDKAKADQIIARTSGQQGMVTSVTSTEKKDYAPRLYCLSTLQRDASARFKFGAKKTLDIAQSLYEKRGMISYPRTSSQHVTKDEIPVMQGVFKKLEGTFPQWSKNAQTKMVHTNNKLICDESKVTDHHALLPTGKYSSSLTPDEKKVYELIVQRFFMQFFPPAVYRVFEAITEVSGELFKTTAKQVLDLGWRANFSRLEEEGEENEEVGFNIQKKPSFCERTEAEEKHTQPPKYFTEGTLITALKMAGNTLDVNDDENKELKEILNSTEGIGTEATRAGIIETLKKREYIASDHGKVVVTPKGKHLIETIRKTPLEILTSASLTAKWEQALTKVAEGKMSPAKFDEQVRSFSQHIVNVVKEQRASTPPPPLFPKKSATGGKSPTSKTTTTTKTKTSGTKGKKTTTKSTTKGSVSKTAIVDIGKCPKCGATLIENSKAYGCSKWRDGCKFTIWKETSKKKIPLGQVKKLVSKGKTDVMEGFKVGNETVSGYLELDSKKDVKMKKV